MTGVSENILVIDDEARMCESLKELLTDRGYNVTTIQSSKQALEEIKNTTYDVVITDIKMPEVSGLEILRAARKKDPETIVILMTGYASLESSLDAIKSGAFEYLLKPVEFSQLEISVKRGLDTRRGNLERARLVSELKETNSILQTRLEEINALYETGLSMTKVIQLNKLLNQIVKLAAGVTKAKIASIMLLDGAGEYLTIEASLGLEANLSSIVKLKKGSSIAGHVAETGEPMIIKNVENSKKFKRINNERYGSASLLCVPLEASGRILGVINMANKKDNQIFTDHDLKLLSTFASQAAVAIDNARQFDDNRRKLYEFSLLFDLSKRLSTVGSVPAMRNAVFEYLQKLMPLDFSLWFEWHPARRCLNPVGASGTDMPLTDSGSIDLSAVNQEEITIDGIDLNHIEFDDIDSYSETILSKIFECPAYPNPGINFRALPVIQENELKYIFCISSIDEKPFSEREISLARLIVSQASSMYDRERALLNATRLLTMGNMISEISHDLRKPLTNIKGWVQILGEKYPEVSSDEKFFGMAEEEVQRLNELVTELVDFSKPHKYETELRDIRQIIGRASEFVGPEMMKRGVTYSEEFQSAEYEIPVNKNQILEIFLNLFLNALDAMNKGDKLKVTGKISRPSFKKRDYLAITVSDTGCGINKENISRIFDRYFTTKDSGTGLGLAVVERIIAAHGGTLEVNSEIGKGTNFILYFPI